MATPTEVMYGREKLELDGGVLAPVFPAIVSRVLPDRSRPNAKLLDADLRCADLAPGSPWKMLPL